MIEHLAKSGEAAKAGPIGLAVILLLCIACYFLFKSMSKHLRNVRENFPTEQGPLPEPDDPRDLPQRPTTVETAEKGAPPTSPEQTAD